VALIWQLIGTLKSFISEIYFTIRTGDVFHRRITLLLATQTASLGSRLVKPPSGI
jgi:hypothetical protein